MSCCLSFWSLFVMYHTMTGESEVKLGTLNYTTYTGAIWGGEGLTVYNGD